MIKKKWMAVSLVVAVTLSSLTGCGNSNRKNTTEDTTKIVQVTRVDGNTITADVGEYSSKQQEKSPGGDASGDHRKGGIPSGTPDDNKEGDGTPPEGVPSGAPDDNKNGDGTPPEGVPSGAPDDNNKGDGTPPENAPSAEPDNNEVKEENDTEKSEDGSSESSDNNSSSDQKEHGNSGEGNGELPAGKSGRNRFTANGESITFTITDSTEITQETQQGSEAASLEDIVENSVLEITLDSRNQATKVIIKNFQAGGGRFDGSDQATNGTDVSAIIFEENTVNEEIYSL